MEKFLEDIKKGVPLSFDAIYDLYTPLINSITEKFRVKYSLSTEDAEEMRQEASIALYDAALSYNPDRGVSFGLYAKICIKNRLTSILFRRGKSIKAEYIDDENEPASKVENQTPEEVVINRESFSEIKKRICQSLTDLERSVFDLYIAGASYEDISTALGISKKSADNAMQRIKAKLKKLYQS